ncbi:MAG TPA: YbhB/YbcL family Raf kinase inhibitor-like protein [Caulobacteraceae bacterium]
MRMLVIFALSLVAAGQSANAATSDPRTVIGAVQAQRAAPLVVASPAFALGRVALRNTSYGANLSPAVRWSAMPGARAYALILEDPDAHTALPFAHWLVWNLPTTTNGLAEGQPRSATLATGAAQGANDAGGVGYYGPHPPAGPAHLYHLEVFALDAPLTLASGAGRAALADALRGHIIADGETVAAFKAP